MLRSRDDRRRRALTDEALRADESPTVTDTTAEPALYTNSEQALAERRLRDLIPCKTSGLAIVYTIWIAVSAIIMAGSYYASAVATWLQVSTAPALDLSQPTHLASAWTTINLLAASCLTGIIYSLRRGRLDDYRGNYRWWAMFVTLIITTAVATLAPVYELVQLVGQRITRYDGAGANLIWWLAPTLMLWSLVGLRIALEVRRSLPTSITFGIALISATISLSLRCDWLVISQPTSNMLLWGSQLVAAVMLHLGCVSYARHLLLEIQGIIASQPVIKKKASKTPRKEKKTWFWGSKQKNIRVDQAHTPPAQDTVEEAPVEKTVAKKPHFAVKPEPKPEPAPAPLAGKIKLSRAERKRLRKLNADQDDDDEDE
jgi:hypothetical protein